MSPRKNLPLYAEWANHIECDETRIAYRTLIGAAAESSSFSCYPTRSGVVRYFRICDHEQEQLFSFIVNKNWLLFYFRPTAVRRAKFSKVEIERHFGKVNDINTDEWTVRVRSRKDAMKIIRRVFSAWNR